MISAFEHIQADNFDESDNLDKAAALKKRVERLAQLSFVINLVGMICHVTLNLCMLGNFACLYIIRIYQEFFWIANSVPGVTAWHYEALPSDAKQ